MYLITRRYHWEAAHFLPHVPEEHKCKRLHGHNYELEVTLGAGMLDQRGWLLDFWDLDKLVQPIVDTIDHRCLNDIDGLHNPTAEEIAVWFHRRLAPKLAPPARIHELKVYETKDAIAVFRPETELVIKREG